MVIPNHPLKPVFDAVVSNPRPTGIDVGSSLVMPQSKHTFEISFAFVSAHPVDGFQDQTCHDMSLG
jgi:hypothetical protein